MADLDQLESSMAERIFCVITVARQINGEYVFIRTEKAFKQAGKADSHLKELKKKYAGEDGKIKPISLSTPNGEAECFCEVGAFEIEVEE
jgi:predicted double-glycine peptidase